MNRKRICCKQTINNDMIVTYPEIINHVAEKMATELGKQIADLLCDEKTYAMRMMNPTITDNYDNSTEYRSDIRYQEIVTCKECANRYSPNRERFCIGRHDDFFCADGTREVEWRPPIFEERKDSE